MSGPAHEIALGKWVAAGLRRIGQISIAVEETDSFVLTHREDAAGDDLMVYAQPEDAAEIARFDDAGKYRSLKTAPNLRHGWRLLASDLTGLRLALDLFYPGRLPSFLAWENARLRTTSLRQTLARQTGMYRTSAKISDDEADTLVGNFCRSDGGCLRTILWRRDETGAVASTRLPAEKFAPRHDQAGSGEAAIPLLCPEACHLLVAEARRVVKSEAAASPAT